MPIYIVSPGNRLVRANTYSQAVNYAAKAMFKAAPVKADTLADMLAKGAKIEDARAPVNQELPLETPAAVPQEIVDTTLRNGNAKVTEELGRLPSTGGPLEPEVREAVPDHFGDRHHEGSMLPRGRTITQPDDIDTITLEGIDHVQ